MLRQAKLSIVSINVKKIGTLSFSDKGNPFENMDDYYDIRALPANVGKNNSKSIFVQNLTFAIISFSTCFKTIQGIRKILC